MTRVIIKPSRDDISTPHTLIAQKYAGALVGHSYRHRQQTENTVANGNIVIDKATWKEPVVFADDCDFCQLSLTDSDVTRRVAGYQHQIDIEVMRGHTRSYNDWLSECGPEVIERYVIAGEGVEREYGVQNSRVNRRLFCETRQDQPNRHSEDGWKQKPFPMIALPLRLKRKLCIEWNHLYRDYLVTNPQYHYDFEKHEFYEDREPPAPCEDCGGVGVLTQSGADTWIHTEGCPTTTLQRQWYAAQDGLARQLWAMYFGGVRAEAFFENPTAEESSDIPVEHDEQPPNEEWTLM